MDCIAVDGDGSETVAIAKRRPDKRGQRNGGVVGFQKFGKKAFVPAIPTHDIKGLGGAAFCEGVLAKDETVENRDGMPGGEELRDEDGTEIASTAGDEDFLRNLRSRICQLRRVKSKLSAFKTALGLG